MDTKKIIIIVIAVIIVLTVAFGIYYYFNFSKPEIKYENINVTSTFSLDIPISDNITNKTISNRINIINDTKDEVTITSFNSDGTSFDELLTDGPQFAALRDSYKIGSEQIQLANQTVWYNENTGYYMVYYSLEETHDNVIIVSKNNDTLAHMMSTVKIPSGNVVNSSSAEI